jgi:Ser/Thr protein kinase RdoA (MazF antagonist)
VSHAFAPLAGGFHLRCWSDGRQVVKIWDDGLPASLPALTDLADDLPVVAPLATAVIGGWGVGVFPFVAGRAATSADDVPVLARTLRLLHDHPVPDLPRHPIEEDWALGVLRDGIDHPWIGDRRAEVTAQLDRLEAVIERARAVPRPEVACHTDFGGHNVLVDEATGEVTGIIDWDYARIGAREHDLWAAFDEPDPGAYLDAYGRDVALDPVHLEYALLARAVRDTAARVANRTDRAGIETWGFDRWRRLDRDLELACGPQPAAGTR